MGLRIVLSILVAGETILFCILLFFISEHPHLTSCHQITKENAGLYFQAGFDVNLSKFTIHSILLVLKAGYFRE